VACGVRAQCLGMMGFADLTSVPADHPAPFTDQLRLAVAAYLARFAGSSRQHTESDLRCYLSWCTERGLDPLAARRPHLELYIRWMQEIRHVKPSTVSRRFSVVAGFYKTCVVDGLLDHSPAEHVRRPAVPPESPTLGFTHLQFEALLTAARQSPDPCNFALVTMLGLPGLRIFEATAAGITDLGEEHGHRVLRVRGKCTKAVLVPLPPAAARAIDRAIGARTSGVGAVSVASARWRGVLFPFLCSGRCADLAARGPGPRPGYRPRSGPRAGSEGRLRPLWPHHRCAPPGRVVPTSGTTLGPPRPQPPEIPRIPR
jgi:integrase